MAFKNIARQGVRPGHVVRYTLPGIRQFGPEKPAFDIEGFGPSNSTALGEAILKAGQKTELDASEAQPEPSQALVAPPSTAIEAFEAWRKGWEEKREALVKYCIKGVFGFYHDDENGEPDLEHPATLEDVPSILEALPLQTLMDLFTFCLDRTNFEERNKQIEDVAKK